MTGEALGANSLSDPADEIRSFNRFWTARIGVLQAGLLDTPYSLTEARVIFEVANRPGSDVGSVRAELGIDAGYLSRIVGKLESEGLLRVDKAPHDARRKVLSLTAVGEGAFEDLDQRSRHEIKSLLSTLTKAETESALTAMRSLKNLFSTAASSGHIAIRDASPGDYGWIVDLHASSRTLRYGWDERYEAFVAETLATFVHNRDFRREGAWIVELDGSRVGAGICVMESQDTGMAELLIADARVAGQGVESALIGKVLDCAAGAGYLELKTVLPAIDASMRDAVLTGGFEVVDQRTHTDFGPRVVEETWLATLPTV